MVRIEFGSNRSGPLTLASCLFTTLFCLVFFGAGLFFAGILLTTYFNPDENDGGPAMLLFLVIPLVFMAIGIGAPVAMWRRYLREQRGEVQAIAAAAPTPAKRKLGTKGIVGFFSIFFIMGSAFFYFMFLGPVLNIFAARSWVATPCVIEHSELERHSDSDGVTYEIDMRYRYTYEGNTYHAERYWFAFGSSSNYDGRRAIVDAHPAGSETSCYVDPDNPSEAVIDRSFPGELWFGLLPLIFVLVGLSGMIGAPVYQARQNRRDPDRAWLPQSGDSDTASPYGAPHDVSALTLRPTLHRWGKLGGMILFALFWNGLTSVFVVIAVNSHLDGDPEWFLTFFIIPFVLVGLGLLGGVAYSALALLNPIIELTVSAREVALGETLDLSWRIDGSPRRLRKLAFTLEGQEKATYRRGTRTTTDTHTFASVPVQTLDDARAIQAGGGEATVQVPADTMHSFKADRNEIVWKLKVHGDVPRWPDVQDEYDLTVLPQRDASAAQEGSGT